MIFLLRVGHIQLLVAVVDNLLLTVGGSVAELEDEIESVERVKRELVLEG
jgi:hypothetical protein